MPKGWIQKSNKYSNVLQTGFKTELEILWAFRVSKLKSVSLSREKMQGLNDMLLNVFTDTLQDRGQENVKFGNIQVAETKKENKSPSLNKPTMLGNFAKFSADKLIVSVGRNVLREELTKNFFVFISTKFLWLNASKFGADDHLPLTFANAHAKMW